jgi:hypothetical protein
MNIKKYISVTLVCADERITNLNMFTEFINFYSNLTYIILVIDVKNNDSLNKMLNIIKNFNNVRYTLVENSNYYDIANLKYKTILLDSLKNINIADGDWIIYADIDEFINFDKGGILNCLHNIQDNKIIVNGHLRDLLSEDKKIPDFVDIKSSYSYYSRMSGRKLGLGTYKKVCATKYPLVVHSQPHHACPVSNTELIFEQVLNVFHVRFTKETFFGFKNKETEKLAQSAKRIGRRRRKMIEKRNRKVLPILEQGLIPDFFYRSKVLIQQEV